MFYKKLQFVATIYIVDADKIHLHNSIISCSENLHTDSTTESIE